MVPLTAVRRADFVVWLLSHGADPNGDSVMHYAAWSFTAAVLQLLIDAGGDVNRYSGFQRPLFLAVHFNCENHLRVLLAHPYLDLAVTCDDRTPEQYAHHFGKPALADMIAQEVRRGFLAAFTSSVAANY